MKRNLPFYFALFVSKLSILALRLMGRKGTNLPGGCAIFLCRDFLGRMPRPKTVIGITGTNARPSIAPTFGVENMLGTNPLTFGIPTDEELEAMPVVQLRVLARSLNVEGMSRREIRDAKKEPLLAEIRACLARRGQR